jgi:magnesium chelatase family protein
MLARVQSCAVHGIEGIPLAVEVDNSPETNNTTIVGLPDTAIRESRDRVFSAIKNSGFRLALA